MGKYTQWITHKEKRMLLVNGPGSSEAQYIEAMEEMKLEILKETRWHLGTGGCLRN